MCYPNNENWKGWHEDEGSCGQEQYCNDKRSGGARVLKGISVVFVYLLATILAVLLVFLS